MAHPYPVGYDVINYYIPVLANFQEHWEIVSQQFPLYVLILHSFQIATDLEPQALVIASAIILYGIFSISVFSISSKLLGLNDLYSLYLTLFVIFQLPVLRTGLGSSQGHLLFSLIVNRFISYLSSKSKDRRV